METDTYSCLMYFQEFHSIPFYERMVIYLTSPLIKDIGHVKSLLLVKGIMVMDVPPYIYLCGFGYVCKDKCNIGITWTKGMYFNM